MVVIGVDDFAFKKRKSYGTVVVNLETKKAIDLLPDRSSGELSKWLKGHPQIKTIARDRSTEYAKGIAEGCPQAQTVLDRFHLIKNLGEVLERVVQQHQGAIKAIAEKWGIRPRKRTTKEEQMREGRRKARHQRYQEIRERHQRGESISHIMQALGASRTQIRRAIHADQLPERHGNHHQGSILEPYQPHLQKRWDEGIRNANQLFREIAIQGFVGTPKQVYRWAQERREQPYKHKAIDVTGETQKSTDPTIQAPRFSEVGLAPRQLAWLLREDDATLEEHQRLVLQNLLDVAPRLKMAQMLAHQFQQLFRDKKADAVEVWLTQAIESDIAEFKSFATSLKREVEALKAAITLAWSNGPVEGWVNKIKFIKRQMYGRASFDLLRKRVLLSP
jgi:transposase